MNLSRSTFILSLLSFVFLMSATSFAQSGRNISQYNLNSGTGLKGFDPVAVFPEGGSSAQKGLQEIGLIHSGVMYSFANQANLETFNKSPEKYEPSYGGWCAYAMASGSKVDIQPQLFTIHGNRAHYFVSSRAKQNFDRDVAGFEKNADGNWKKISGEDPRL
jgi:hypothetical protein